MMTAGRWRTVWQGARLGFVFVQRRKLCYYRRLEYDFLAFFCALLPTSLFRHVHSTIFVFLRLCSSHQLLYTLTKYVNVKTTKTTTNNVYSQARHTYVCIHVTKDTFAFIYSDICYRSTCTSTSTFAIYSHIYAHIKCGTRRHGSVIAVAPVVVRAHTTTKPHELKTALDAVRGGWKANKGPPESPSRPKPIFFGWRARDKRHCTHQHINTPKGRNTILLNKETLWANVLRIFSQASTRRRP